MKFSVYNRFVYFAYLLHFFGSRGPWQARALVHTPHYGHGTIYLLVGMMRDEGFKDQMI